MTDAAKLRLDNKIAGRAMRMIRDKSYGGTVTPPPDLEDFSTHLYQIANAMLGNIETMDGEALDTLAAIVQKANNFPERPTNEMIAMTIKRMAARLLAFEELEEIPRNRAKRFTELYVSMCPAKKLRKTG